MSVGVGAKCGVGGVRRSLTRHTLTESPHPTNKVLESGQHRCGGYCSLGNLSNGENVSYTDLS